MNLKKNLMRWETSLLVVIVLEIVVFGIINPTFFKPSVILGSITDYISVCIISLFVTFVLITGGMDIQAGSIVGLSSITLGLLWSELGLNVWVAAILAVVVGGICGAISGFFVAYIEVQPMVVTLGGSFLFSGIAIAANSLSDAPSHQGITGYPESFLDLTKLRLFGVIPSQVVIFVVLIIIGYILLQKTVYGRKVYLSGVNKDAAEYSGISTKPIIMSTYILSGASAALAGVILTSYLGTSKPDYGKELTLPIITAVVLGGTSNYGGVGTVIGTALASLVICFLRFGLSMAQIQTQYLDIFVGVLLIIAVALRSNPNIFKRFSVKKLDTTEEK